MYTVAVQKELIAQHFLTGGDWGAENTIHSHGYRVEVQLEGADLDQHGFLLDITVVEACLGSVLDVYRDHVLNEMPAFLGLNPSIEHFSRILCHELRHSLVENGLPQGLNSLRVVLWETATAWAAYRLEL